MPWGNKPHGIALMLGALALLAMPMAAPIRIEAKEARNAAVELMVSSPCHDARR